MKKYTITLTKDQMQSIQIALNCTFRFKMGQCGEIVDRLQHINGDFRDKNGEILFDYDLVKDIENLIKPKMGLSSNGYIGVNRIDSIDQMITIHDGIRNFLSWESATEEGLTDGKKRDWGTMMTVDFDEPTNYFGGLIEIRKVEE